MSPSEFSENVYKPLCFYLYRVFTIDYFPQKRGKSNLGHVILITSDKSMYLPKVSFDKYHVHLTFT